jgi:2-dehydro-3-deoxyphosphogluconate aldolase/(4S)-4-hydroxy-2-oxoglutarate aldolase
MMDRNVLISALRDTGVVAVIRTENPVDLGAVAKALREGGIKFIEITMTIPWALEIIKEVARDLRDLDIYVGAGTVLDAETARMAILAGSHFIVGPTFDQGTVDLCHSYGIPVMPGAMTPTEILCAWKGGADVVKVFPAQNVGGADFLKAVKEPLPQIELLPTKGVDFETAGAFIKAGAIAVGVGGALVPKAMMATKDYPAITANARRMIQIVRDARAGSAR